MQYDVITIGTATRDAFVRSSKFSIRRDARSAAGEMLCMPAGAKIEVPDLTFATGGGATNAAVTFARQGLRCACIAKIGDDVSGKEVRRGLMREKVDDAFLVISPKHKTAYAILILAESGERTILVYRGAGEHLRFSEIPKKSLQARWFCIFPGGALSVVEHALRYAKSQSIRVALNPSGPMLKRGASYFKKIISHVDVLIMNREEGSRITGISQNRPEAIFKKLDAWMPCLAVLTDGKRGVYVSDGVSVYRAGVYHEKRIADRTGAGDAFGSGFVAGLLQTRTRIGGRAVCDLYPPEAIEFAIKLGSANATAVVEHIGAKEGILAKRDFAQNPRWKNLAITRIKLSH